MSGQPPPAAEERTFPEIADGPNKRHARADRFIDCEYDRMIVLFSMPDGAREIPCAISTSAMDYLEGGPQVRPEEREAQFTRLQGRLKLARQGKYRAAELEGTPPGLVLRGTDFRP